MNANLSIVQAILLLAGGLIVYFIPNWVANARKHHNANAIFVTNLFLGWTFIGWVAALIWSFTEVKAKTPENIESQLETKECPFCAETIKAQAKVVQVLRQRFTRRTSGSKRGGRIKDPSYYA